mmetsp:Transcript_14159/g.29121  ORF Transcript_14159/g.29121 Transcript_14159/m.29121 type:complete len:119 (-) Transcript_14159:760-1116(-)
MPVDTELKTYPQEIRCAHVEYDTLGLSAKKVTISSQLRFLHDNGFPGLSRVANTAANFQKKEQFMRNKAFGVTRKSDTLLSLLAPFFSWKLVLLVSGPFQKPLHHGGRYQHRDDVFPH